MGKRCSCDWTTLRSHFGQLTSISSCTCSFSSQRRKIFQQDGATCHNARTSMAVVKNLFTNHVHSRNVDILWPDRSPSCTCDFLLWGYLKSHVFEAPAPPTVQELKHRIRKKVERIPLEMLHIVILVFRTRLTECLQ